MVNVIFRVLLISNLLLGLIIAQAFEGYTLYSPTGSGNINGVSYLIDNELNIINTWTHSRGAASMPYLLQDSSIIYPHTVANPTMSTGGVGGGIAKITWSGDIVWDYTISNNTYQHHHDIMPLPNGNILAIVWERKTASEAYAKGRTSLNNSLNEMWSTAILEIQPFGSNGGNVVWEWHLWDHLVQNNDPGLPNYGVISEHPELMDVNYGTVGGGGGPGGANADWMHVNAIDYNLELDQIVFSSRHQNEIYIIDHSTTTAEAASHEGGNSGKGGDFLFRWGNPQVYDRGTNNNQQLQGQHGVNWIPESYPGGGNLMIFNNQYQNNNSAVFEIETPINANDTYLLEDDMAYGPNNPVWLHSVGEFSSVQSGAFRLPNGNTLISVADDALILEVTNNGTAVWNYEHPTNNTMIARAQKYSVEYLSGNNTGFPEYILGDINFDEEINIIDLLYLSDMVIGSYSSYPTANVHIGSDEINISDILSLLALIIQL